MFRESSETLCCQKYIRYVRSGRFLFDFAEDERASYDTYRALRRKALEAEIFDLERASDGRRWQLNDTNFDWLSEGERKEFLDHFSSHVQQAYSSFAEQLNHVAMHCRHASWEIDIDSADEAN